MNSHSKISYDIQDYKVNHAAEFWTIRECLKFVRTKARRAIHLMTRRGELEVHLMQFTVPLFCFVVGRPGDYCYVNAR